MVSIIGCQPPSATIYEQLNADLLGHWTMDQIDNEKDRLLHDLGPFNLTGKSTGNVRFTEDRFGQSGKALYFNGGLYDYVHIPHDRRFERMTSKVTIAMWIYNERNSTTFHPNIIHNAIDGSFLVSKGRDMDDGSWFMSTKSLVLQQPSTGDNQKWHKKGNGFKSSVDLPMNQWVFLVGVVNDTNGKMYVNGDVWHFSPNGYQGNYRSEGNTNPIILGQHHTQPTGWKNEYIYPFRGKMDEVRIWNRALSEHEVRALYDAERPSAWQEELQTPVFKWSMGLVFLFIVLWGVWYWGQKSGRTQALTLQEAHRRTGQIIIEKGTPTDAIYIEIEPPKEAITKVDEQYQPTISIEKEQTKDKTVAKATFHENLPDFLNPPTHLSIEDQNRYLKIIETIEANKNTFPFGTKELANTLNTTTRTLQRDAKQLFGCSPKRVIEIVLTKV